MMKLVSGRYQQVAAGFGQLHGPVPVPKPGPGGVLQPHLPPEAVVHLCCLLGGRLAVPASSKGGGSWPWSQAGRPEQGPGYGPVGEERKERAAHWLQHTQGNRVLQRVQFLET